MVTPDQHTPAFKIFHYYYKAYLPQHQLYSDDYRQTYGIPTSGDATVDRQMAHNLTLCQLTISTMANHYDGGTEIKLLEPKDSVTIYQIIRAHLMDWQRVIQQSIGEVHDVPLEDLKKLDQLGLFMYHTAKFYMAKDVPQNSLFKQIEALENRATILREDPKEKQEKMIQAPVGPKITDNITKELFSRTKSWRG